MELYEQSSTYHIFQLLLKLLPQDNPYQLKTTVSSPSLTKDQIFPAIDNKHLVKDESYHSE